MIVVIGPHVVILFLSSLTSTKFARQSFSWHKISGYWELYDMDEDDLALLSSLYGEGTTLFWLLTILACLVSWICDE